MCPKYRKKNRKFDGKWVNKVQVYILSDNRWQLWLPICGASEVLLLKIFLLRVCAISADKLGTFHYKSEDNDKQHVTKSQE